MATHDAFYKPPTRGPVTAKINKLYDTTKKKKEEDLNSAEYVALTGDHWTSSYHKNMGTKIVH